MRGFILIRLSFVIVVSTFPFGGCHAPLARHETPTTAAAAPASATNPTTSPHARRDFQDPTRTVQPGDRICIIMLQKTGAVDVMFKNVDPLGRFRLPYLGIVPVGGRTAGELSNELKEKFQLVDGWGTTFIIRFDDPAEK